MISQSQIHVWLPYTEHNIPPWMMTANYAVVSSTEIKFSVITATELTQITKVLFWEVQTLRTKKSFINCI